MQEDYLRKGNQLTEDQPVVNHLRIGGQGKFLHDADEDGRHHQHVGQVHCEGGLKEEWLEEGGGKGDHEEEEGGEVGGQHLAHDLSLQKDPHPHSRLLVTEIPSAHMKQIHISILLHPQLFWDQPHCGCIHVGGSHLY